MRPWPVAVLVVGLLAALPAPARAVAWHRCGGSGSWKCARVAVPADYRDRSAGKLSLSVTRHPAAHPGRHRHAVFLNYGGPGASAVPSTWLEARFLLGRAAFRRLDVVAFDPRGTGASRPSIDCDVDQETTGLYAEPFTRPATVDRTALVARARGYVDRCLERNPRVLPFVSTAANARDMDRLRKAVGVRRLDYLGFSYGTFLGATYAALFPHHIRTMVLDGPVDPVSYLGDPLGDEARQTAGFEGALRRYLHTCDRRRDRCAFRRGGSARAAFDRIATGADAHPLPVGRRGRPADGDDVRAAAVDALYSKFTWPDLTRALDQAARGSGIGIRALSDDSYGRRSDGSYSPELDRYFAITAVEAAYPQGVQPYLDAGRRSYRRFGHFWFNSGYSELPYGLYPVAGRDVFRGPFTLPRSASGTPLVVATTHDPATPYAGGRRMVAALGRARLLTMRGDGHTATGGNSRCIDHAVRRYLLTTRLPPRGTVCRQHVPFSAAAAAATSAAAAGRRDVVSGPPGAGSPGRRGSPSWPDSRPRRGR